MKKQFIKATRSQILAALKASDIDRRIDKMDLHEERNFILLDDARDAAKDARYKTPRAAITVKTFVTHKSGMYGHQFLSAVWVHVPGGGYYQASGAMTGGCGYDKISTAIESALWAVGLTSDLVEHFGGTGQHQDVLRELMQVLAGRKAWFEV